MATTADKNETYKIGYEGRDKTNTVGIDPGVKRDMPKIAKVVAQEAKDLSQKYGFDQIIRSSEGPFRPYDGAAAFARALKRAFNTDGVGKEIRSFFGTTPPLFIDVQVQNLIYKTGDGRQVKEDSFYNDQIWPIADLVSYAISEGVSVPSPYGERDRLRIVDDLIERWSVVGTVTETVSVPWGRVEIPGTDIEVTLMEDEDDTFGPVFRMGVFAPKLEKDLVDLLRETVMDELERRSIYKGRCLYTSNQTAPTFWCPFRATKAEELILPVVLQTRIENEIYSILRNMPEARKTDPGLLTRSFLFAGDYGTGKTQEMNIVAQVAMQNGVTVIRHRPGDNLSDTQRMAALHAPSLIQIEDVEAYMPIREGMDKAAYRTATTKVLEAFDGALTKGREVLTIMTTNDPDLVAPGMSRTGRTDGLYHFHSLDRDGLERLIILKLGSRLAKKIDYDAVWAEAHDMSSSFLAEIVKRSTTYLLGQPDKVLDTEDLKGIVAGLREHYEWHLRVKALEEGQPEPTMREYQASIVHEQVTRVLTESLPNWGFDSANTRDGKYPLRPLSKTN